MKKRPEKRPALNPPFARPTRPLSAIDTQRIYCGDNKDVLAQLPGKSVDLIYVDPPFNSNRVYETFWGETKEKRSFEDRHESTVAYVDYMKPRCMELARVLKETGSFYYHCDWHASHYVKVMLDHILGENNFQNEVVWKRSTAHSDAKQGSKHYGRVHDVLLFYTGSPEGYTWNQLYTPLSPAYVESHYGQMDPDGRRFQWTDLTGPGGAAKGNPYYEVLGVAGYWRYKQDRMEELIRQGRVAVPPTARSHGTSAILTSQRGFRSKASGMTSRPSTHRRRKRPATRRKSRWAFWSASSKRQATRTTSYWTPSAAVGPRSWRPKS